MTGLTVTAVNSAKFFSIELLSSFLHGCHRETDFYGTDMKMHKLDDERPTVKLNLFFRVSTELQGVPSTLRPGFGWPTKIDPRLCELASGAIRSQNAGLRNLVSTLSTLPVNLDIA